MKCKQSKMYNILIKKSIARLIDLLNETKMRFRDDIQVVSDKTKVLLTAMLEKDPELRISWEQLFTIKISKEGTYKDIPTVPKTEQLQSLDNKQSKMKNDNQSIIISEQKNAIQASDLQKQLTSSNQTPKLSPRKEDSPLIDKLEEPKNIPGEVQNQENIIQVESTQKGAFSGLVSKEAASILNKQPSLTQDTYISLSHQPDHRRANTLTDAHLNVNKTLLVNNNILNDKQGILLSHGSYQTQYKPYRVPSLEENDSSLSNPKTPNQQIELTSPQQTLLSPNHNTTPSLFQKGENTFDQQEIIKRLANTAVSIKNPPISKSKTEYISSYAEQQLENQIGSGSSTLPSYQNHIFTSTHTHSFTGYQISSPKISELKTDCKITQSSNVQDENVSKVQSFTENKQILPSNTDVQTQNQKNSLTQDYSEKEIVQTQIYFENNIINNTNNKLLDVNKIDFSEKNQISSSKGSQIDQPSNALPFSETTMVNSVDITQNSNVQSSNAVHSSENQSQDVLEKSSNDNVSPGNKIIESENRPYTPGKMPLLTEDIVQFRKEKEISQNNKMCKSAENMMNTSIPRGNSINDQQYNQNAQYLMKERSKLQFIAQILYDLLEACESDSFDDILSQLVYQYYKQIILTRCDKLKMILSKGASSLMEKSQKYEKIRSALRREIDMIEQNFILVKSEYMNYILNSTSIIGNQNKMGFEDSLNNLFEQVISSHSTQLQDESQNLIRLRVCAKLIDINNLDLILLSETSININNWAYYQHILKADKELLLSKILNRSHSFTINS